jgi:hypothetical protein
MRDGEDGKALEEKYKELIGPLEKQIEDGIKWEVETKQAALEETKKIVEDELTTLTITAQESANKMNEAASSQNYGTVDDSEMGGFSTPSAAIDLNSFNLPGFGNQLRSGSSSIPASVKKEEAEKTQKEEAEKAKIAEKAKSTDTAKPAAASSKSATLDDVVKSLDMLNKQMGLLISQQDNLMRKQERNIKSAASTNVQDKV